MSGKSSAQLANDNLVLDEQIKTLKDHIKRQMQTVDRLNAGHHETTDATRQLDSLLRRYSSLVQARYMPGAL
jgi:hypothetical protein